MIVASRESAWRTAPKKRALGIPLYDGMFLANSSLKGGRLRVNAAEEKSLR
jgi:hypothetical protein